MTAMAILSLYLSMPKCHGYHIEGWLLSYRVVHWKANAGLLLSYPTIYNITSIILILILILILIILILISTLTGNARTR